MEGVLSETVEIEVEILKITDLAILVDDGDRRPWLSKSLLRKDEIEDCEEGDALKLTIPVWLAMQEGLI